MPEALTESFCERCGTRYEFNAPTRLNPLRKTRGLVSGLRNYIMSQDALSDAMGDAMRSEEDTLAARQLDAFHASFNFCIDCRQYTCVNCWNDDAGRCRSCAPIAGTDDLLERFEASFQAQHPELLVASGTAQLDAPEQLADDGAQRRFGVDAWPTSDLPIETNGHVPNLAWPSDEFVPVEPEPQAAPEPELAPVIAEAEPEPQAAPEPELASEPAWVEPEPALTAAEAPAHLVLLKWEDDAPIDLLPEAVIEPEPAPEIRPQPLVAESAPETLVGNEEWAPEPEPVAALTEPEPVAAEAEPEPVAAETEPEPVAAETEPEPAPEPRHLRPIGDTILHMPRPAPAVPRDEPRVAAQADDPAVAARRAQLDLLGLGDPGDGPLAPRPPNVLPYRSSGASAGVAARAAHAAAAGAFWEASAREVAGAMSQVPVQNCGQCGLSLSATARFCRRCGTRQAQPA